MPPETPRSLNWDQPEDPQALKRGINHLLLIGIDTYQQVAQLNNAVRDAQAFERVLLDKYQFEEKHVHRLFNEQATRVNIANTLRKAVDLVKPKDNLIVYYSGHGHYDEVFKEGYWIPVEAHYGAEVEYIPYAYLKQVIAAVPTQHTLFIVDSCYSGALFVQDRELKTDRFERDPSRWLLASGRNEVVPDGVVGGNSPFAEQLIDLLDRYSHEGLRLGTLADKLTTAVTYNSRQTPIGRPLYEVGDKGGEFVFHPKRNRAADYRAASEQGTSQAWEIFLRNYPNHPEKQEIEAQIARLRDEEAWQKTLQSNTIAAFRSYRRRFTEGQHRSEALDRIEQLEAEQAWRQAESQDTISGYERFLDHHRGSSYEAQANQAIEKLLDQRAWRAAQSAGSAAAFRSYLHEFPAGQFAAKAQAALQHSEQEGLSENDTLAKPTPESVQEEPVRQGFVAVPPAPLPETEQVPPSPEKLRSPVPTSVPTNLQHDGADKRNPRQKFIQKNSDLALMGGMGMMTAMVVLWLDDPGESWVFAALGTLLLGIVLYRKTLPRQRATFHMGLLVSLMLINAGIGIIFILGSLEGNTTPSDLFWVDSAVLIAFIVLFTLARRVRKNVLEQGWKIGWRVGLGLLVLIAAFFAVGFSFGR